MKKLNIIEGIGTVLGMAACVMLNFNSHDPKMYVILTMYTLSALLLAITSYARRTLWIAVLMSFYFFMGCYGIINLFIRS